MLVERVLAHSVVKRDFLVLLWGQSADRVITHGVLKLDLFHDILGHKFLISGNVFNLRLIVHPVWLLRVERLDNAVVPVKVILTLVFLWRRRLLQNMLTVVPIFCDSRLGGVNELI